VKSDEQLERPYEEWAQHKPDQRVLWKQRLSMAAIGADAGLVLWAGIQGLVFLTRPDLSVGISWGGLGLVSSCALFGLIEGWRR
jgi:uncharacterized membrane protein